MKRLYYITQDLDDAEVISDEVHAAGIDDHHFYVVSRDEKGLKTHHLHGSQRLENTHIINARRRDYFIGAAVTGTAIVLLAFLTPLFESMPALPFVLLILLAIATVALVRLGGGSFDEYFTEMFNQHLDDGEVVIVIDVSKDQAHEVESLLERHPKAQFIADCSSLGSAIPD